MGYGVLDFRRRRVSGKITDFVMTVATTTADETFTIPCLNSGVFNCVVDWGDGSTSSITAFNDADLAHTYASAGDHQIKISGAFSNIYFNNGGDKLKVKSVENLGVVAMSGMNSSFFGCTNMVSFVVGNSDTSAVENMNATLRDCAGLTTLNLSGLDTSNVLLMSAAIRDCTSLVSLDLTGWNTSVVSSMFAMLRGNSNLADIVGIEYFDIEGLNVTNGLDFFADGVTLPTARYDALLINWDAQNPLDGMSPNFGNSTYTGGGTAAAARANLISTDGWTITDGGTA